MNSLFSENILQECQKMSESTDSGFAIAVRDNFIYF